MSKKVVAPNTVVMIRPVNFGFNEDAFETNKFQKRAEDITFDTVQERALIEFDNFVNELKKLGVEVIVFEDTPYPKTPDSIFPNNWFSTHITGEIITYPMLPQNRRTERREDIVEELKSQFNYSTRIVLESFEESNPPLFLEGTGSMVIDHQNEVIYAALSPRTDIEVLQELAKQINYNIVSFTAYGTYKELIYHTNVMMCIGEAFVVIGEGTIEPNDSEKVISSLKKGGKEIIQLSNDQVYNHFAGNMLQLRNAKNETILVMSQAAFKSLTKAQVNQLEKHNDHLLKVPLPTIEKVGGGSARCMLAEIFQLELV